MKTRRNILVAFAMVLVAGLTSSATAEVLSVIEFSPIGPVTVDVDDIDLYALVTQGDPGQVIFEFHNESLIYSSVVSINFEDNGLVGIDDIQTPDNVFFEEDNNPANLPGGANLGPAFETAFSIVADPSPVSKGINPGEQLSVTVDLDFSTSYADIISGLTRGDIRIGMHIIALPDGSSFTVVNSVVNQVPEPATLGLLGMGAIFLFSTKKRS